MLTVSMWTSFTNSKHEKGPLIESSCSAYELAHTLTLPLTLTHSTLTVPVP